MIRLGTRRSPLAVAQARLVADGLREAEIVPMSTAGDRDRTRRFDEIGDGRGVFTGDIERALAEGVIDAAVHSAKDLTGDMPADLVIGAMLERDDPRDAMCGPFTSLEEIPDGARIGTSSARRTALLHELRPGLEVVPLRGNVDTRLRQARRRRGRRDRARGRRPRAARPAGADRVHARPARVRPRGRPGRDRRAGAARRRGARLGARPRARRGRPSRPSASFAESVGGGCSVPVAAYAWHEGSEPAPARVDRAVTVYLVGAGPGDPGLLTVRGRELLAAADVLVYDRLADPRIVALAPERTLRVYAGKRPGEHAMTQDAINARLVELGRAHGTVVRLKGGDPFIFGRGGEEALALTAAGIAFEVVPGISSAYAVPAYAGIPVTQRGVAAQVTVVTGHEDPAKPGSDLDWASLAATPGTLVFLMGVGAMAGNAARLIEHGMAGRHAGRGDLRRDAAGPAHRRRTAARHRGRRGRDAPACDHARRRRWRPCTSSWPGSSAGRCTGAGCVVTRARAQASGLAARLEALGAEVVQAPAIRIEPLPFEAPDLAGYDVVVVTSANGVELLLPGDVRAPARREGGRDRPGDGAGPARPRHRARRGAGRGRVRVAARRARRRRRAARAGRDRRRARATCSPTGLRAARRRTSTSSTSTARCPSPSTPGRCGRPTWSPSPRRPP